MTRTITATSAGYIAHIYFDERINEMKFKFGSLDHQKKLAKAVGYDHTQWNSNDPDQVRTLGQLALSAQLSGQDCDGKALSPDDMRLLSIWTGRK